jgi:hypothetical protein
MARKRKTLSKKIRFEVFKRDGFRCQYCGRTAPDVILEIDHIKPVSEGGTDDITNLITSCKDCNLGKGAKLLDDKSILKKQRKQLEELNERREQLEMMMQWREELMKLEDEKVNYIKTKFEERAQCTVTEKGVTTLKKLIRKYPFEIILEAIEDSTLQYLQKDQNGQYTEASKEKAFDYIEKICSVKLATQEKPYLKDLFYIRGILKNRLYYFDASKAIDWLEKAYLRGASIEDLKALAKEVRNWTDFRCAMEEYLAGEK